MTEIYKVESDGSMTGLPYPPEYTGELFPFHNLTVWSLNFAERSMMEFYITFS